MNKIKFLHISVVAACALITFSRFSPSPESIVSQPSGSKVDISREPSALSNARTNTTINKTPNKNSSTTPNLGSASKATSLAQLNQLNQCYKGEGSCDFRQTDPKAYTYAIGQQLSHVLHQIKSELRGQTLVDIARAHMQINDSFVQEAALEIFSSLPPSAENLTVITGALALTPDASLIKPTLEELKRYLNTSWENRVHRFLTELVAHGPHFSSQAASESLLPFINERSLQAYEKTLKRLRPTSRAYQNLEATLREYYLLRQGA